MKYCYYSYYVKIKKFVFNHHKCRKKANIKYKQTTNHTLHNRLTALSPGPPRWAGARTELLDFIIIIIIIIIRFVKSQNVKRLPWYKGRLTEADTPTIRLGATPSGLTSAHLHHLPIFYRPDALPAAQPTVSKHWRQTTKTWLNVNLRTTTFYYNITNNIVKSVSNDAYHNQPRVQCWHTL